MPHERFSLAARRWDREYAGNRGDSGKKMRYLSVCSGIEAASVAWHPLGWEPAAFSEIEAFPRAVLKHHYPAVPLHGDFTTIGGDEYGSVGLLVGGTPCQSFSVAGLRKGLADERGNLALQFLKLLDRTRARWVVWENVPGVLSSNGGRDFGAFLGGLAELGYGWAYRVLDAQYVRVDGYAHAVPQRRRRVFVVGHLGDWRRAAAVLFERESLSGHPAPRREAREGAAPTLAARTRGGGGLGTDFDCDGGLIANALTERPDRGGGNSEGQRLVPVVSPALKARDFKGLSSDGDGDGAPLLAVAHTLSARHDSSPQGGWGGTPILPVAMDLQQVTNKDNRSTPKPVAPSLTEGADLIAFQCHGTNVGEMGTLRAGNGNETGGVPFVAGPVMATYGKQLARAGKEAGRLDNHAVVNMAVRRLTPRECERLQGFPDDYTLVPYRSKSAADGPRYKALGNSMAVNVMRWIGYRIATVEAIA